MVVGDHDSNERVIERYNGKIQLLSMSVGDAQV
jgi:hypothetical protein